MANRKITLDKQLKAKHSQLRTEQGRPDPREARPRLEAQRKTQAKTLAGMVRELNPVVRGSGRTHACVRFLCSQMTTPLVWTKLRAVA